MRKKDLERAKKYLECEVSVDKVEPAREGQFGLFQSIRATLTSGEPLTIIYYPLDETLAIPLDTAGRHMFRVKWESGDYYKGNPIESMDEPVESTKDKWHEINLGKCRHGIVMNYARADMLPNPEKEAPSDIKSFKRHIAFWAKFSMTGEINE